MTCNLWLPRHAAVIQPGGAWVSRWPATVCLCCAASRAPQSKAVHPMCTALAAAACAEDWCCPPRQQLHLRQAYSSPLTLAGVPVHRRRLPPTGPAADTAARASWWLPWRSGGPTSLRWGIARLFLLFLLFLLFPLFPLFYCFLACPPSLCAMCSMRRRSVPGAALVGLVSRAAHSGRQFRHHAGAGARLPGAAVGAAAGALLLLPGAVGAVPALARWLFVHEECQWSALSAAALATPAADPCNRCPCHARSYSTGVLRGPVGTGRLLVRPEACGMAHLSAPPFCCLCWASGINGG